MSQNVTDILLAAMEVNELSHTTMAGLRKIIASPNGLDKEDQNEILKAVIGAIQNYMAVTNGLVESNAKLVETCEEVMEKYKELLEGQGS